MKVFLDLFIEFFQIGLFAIGGGPATIPFLMDLPITMIVASSKMCLRVGLIAQSYYMFLI